jgi:protein SCO1/2
MRGWVLLALARAGLTDHGLPFVLEELDAGVDPYLMAAAARALRTYPGASSEFAPFVVRAIANTIGHDEPVSFDTYGEYATSASDSSALGDLFTTLAWLGVRARGVLPQLEELRSQPGTLSSSRQAELNRAIASLQDIEAAAEPDCCGLPEVWSRAFARAWRPEPDRTAGPIAFEDQSGAGLTFDECFRGHPTIVVFFYTRCDNPLKCSLTVTKLARVQRRHDERGLSAKVGIAAVTYDPAFDLPQRLRTYGERRGLRFDSRCRMLRTTQGFDRLRRRFALGVGFVESLVNRHRIEAFVLDDAGRIVFSFERVRWDEAQLADRAAELAAPQRRENNHADDGTATTPDRRPFNAVGGTTFAGAIAAAGLALIPKCPLCWSAYLSGAGLAGFGALPSVSWIEPLLFAMLAVNVTGAWLRGRAIGRFSGASLATIGAIAVTMSRTGSADLAGWGIAAIMAGAVINGLPRFGIAAG